ncbi:MAG: hypothetical protein LC623_05720 [Halobacteriales archaeon]|nr:hypothetical protein [Halobacteriales archaeon]
MSAKSRALEASLSLVRDRKVGGNTHPSMLRHRYVSASRLVQMTAKALITDILADEDRDPEGAHWGEDGNAKAEKNLAAVKCQEPSLAVPILGTGFDGGTSGPSLSPWVLTGHPDGLAITTTGENGADRDPFTLAWSFSGGAERGLAVPWFATIFENKAPLFTPGADKVELYYRQGLLYLAMLHAMHERLRARVLHPAAWLADEDPRKRPWMLPETLEPGQVVVCIQPSTEQKREQAFPVDAAACAKHLDFYLRKAAVVVEGVEAKDPGVGERKWDAEKGAGLGEFTIKGAIPVLGDDEVVRITAQRQAAQMRRDEADEEVERLTTALRDYLRAKGVEEATVPCDGGSPYRVVLQRTKGGLRHFVVEDSVALRVYGGVKKAKPASAAPAAAQTVAVTA